MIAEPLAAAIGIGIDVDWLVGSAYTHVVLNSVDFD